MKLAEEVLKARRPDVDAACDALQADGVIVRVGGKNGKWQVAQAVARTTSVPPGGTWHGGTALKGADAANHRGHAPGAGVNVPPHPFAALST